MFMVLVLKDAVEFTLPDGEKVEADAEFAEGMVGFAPIFDTLESAVKFAGKDFQIVELQSYLTGKVKDAQVLH